MPKVIFNDIPKNNVEGIPITYTTSGNTYQLFYNNNFISDKRYFNCYVPGDILYGSKNVEMSYFTNNEDYFSPLTVPTLYSSILNTYGIFEQSMYYKNNEDNIFKTEGKIIERIEQSKFNNIIYESFPSEQSKDDALSIVEEDFVKDQFMKSYSNNIDDIEELGNMDYVDIIDGNEDIRYVKIPITTNTNITFQSNISILNQKSIYTMDVETLSGFLNNNQYNIESNFSFSSIDYVNSNVWNGTPVKFRTYYGSTNPFNEVDLSQEVYILKDSSNSRVGLYQKIYDPDDRTKFYFLGFYGNAEFGDVKIINYYDKWYFISNNCKYDVKFRGDGIESLTLHFYLNNIFKKTYTLTKYTEYNFFIPQFYNTHYWQNGSNNYTGMKSQPATLILESDYTTDETFIAVDPQSYSILI